MLVMNSNWSEMTNHKVDVGTVKIGGYVTCVNGDVQKPITDTGVRTGHV